MVATFDVRVRYNDTADYAVRNSLACYGSSIGITYNIKLFETEVLNESTAEFPRGPICRGLC